MNPWGLIADRVQRWRHSRGFGVHSPLCYTLVREVVRPDRAYGWYGYRDIHRKARDMGDLRAARLLLRVCAVLRPGSVRLPAHPTPALRTAVRAGCPAAYRAGGSPALMAVPYRDATPVEMARHIRQGAEGTALLVWDVPASGVLADMLAAEMECGLILEGRRTVLAVVRAQMPLVRHTVNFRL